MVIMLQYISHSSVLAQLSVCLSLVYGDNQGEQHGRSHVKWWTWLKFIQVPKKCSFCFFSFNSCTIDFNILDVLIHHIAHMTYFDCAHTAKWAHVQWTFYFSLRGYFVWGHVVLVIWKAGNLLGVVWPYLLRTRSELGHLIGREWRKKWDHDLSSSLRKRNEHVLLLLPFVIAWRASLLSWIF